MAAASTPASNRIPHSQISIEVPVPVVMPVVSTVVRTSSSCEEGDQPHNIRFYLLDKGQTHCRRLPHEWGLGKGKTEASLPPQNLRRGCFEPVTLYKSLRCQSIV